jgi:hypothetical protein
MFRGDAEVNVKSPDSGTLRLGKAPKTKFDSSSDQKSNVLISIPAI